MELQLRQFANYRGNFEKRYPKKTIDLATEEIFSPLGITKFQWNTDPSGTQFGGWGLFLTPRDLARFGYLYLKKGNWNGKQLISEKWINEATLARAQTPWHGDKYGYHLWTPRVGGYAAFGFMGQDMFLFPKHDMIVVFTAALPYQEADKILIDLVDDFVLRSFGAKASPAKIE
jgi:CubicO group peptidase (beta-lactamase class C family)